MKKELLVEGENDKHVINNLLHANGIDINDYIVDCRSIQNLSDRLKINLNQEASRIEKLAIVLDADASLESRWQSIKDQINKSGFYKLPKQLPNEGLVVEPIDSNAPRLGVWIMPNNKEKGMLEDFVAMLADDSDELMIEAENELKSLEQKRINKYKPVHRAKAKIHTYLAWQDEPGQQMGKAITTHTLRNNAPIARLFVDWIIRVFNS